MAAAAAGELRRVAILRIGYACLRTLIDQYGFGFRWVGGVGRLLGFAGEYSRYRKMGTNPAFALRSAHILPMVTDRTAVTPIEPIYFLQDTWCATKLGERRPDQHVDVGSSVKSMALIAQFLPVTFVDIRAVDLQVPGFTFRSGSVLELPFADASIHSLSSLCVIEHIGLGRYGDPLDPFGSEKAAAELLRVLAPGGDLYISVPVDRECRVYFNAHRGFTREYLLSLFPGLELAEERYIYDRSLYPNYQRERGFGTGLYHLHRP
jgi:SAM-dependent methyltransferase